jgi:hypothetical protein
MTRNRMKRKQGKIASSSLPKPIETSSPPTQMAANLIANQDPNFLYDKFFHTLLDSAELASEPEFLDLTWDWMLAAQVTERWLKKYEIRLAAAGKENSDEYQQVFDEMRIEVIDELATRIFRKQVNERLQRLIDRLSVKDDLKKLDIALMLKPTLAIKEIPWGLCGLILEIYNRSMDQAMASYQEEQELVQALNEAIKVEGEELNINNLTEPSEKLERIGQKLFENNPGLRERAEKQAEEIADRFEGELAQGKVALDLFTQEELLLPFQRIAEEYGQPVTEMQPTDELREHIFDAIVQATKDILTPERFARFRKDVESTGKDWMHARHKWAAAIQLELSWLEEEAFEGNKFVISAFFGQMYRMGGKQKAKKRKR